MKSKRIKTAFGLLLLFCGGARIFANDITLESMLEGYLKNDLTIQNLSVQLEKEMLNLESSSINSGWNFKLSTGTVSLHTGENFYVEFSPEASVAFPELNNLAVQAGTSIKIGNTGASKPGADDAGSSVSGNISLSVSADIISSASEQRKITELKNERKILEARRKLENQMLTAEKSFYSGLKSLYQIASDILSAEKNVYDSEISFSKVKAQGYNSSSAKYRQAQMDVLSATHNMETAVHKMQRETKIFAAKCGIDISEFEDDAGNFDYKKILPEEIPLVDAVDILDFEKESYKEIESTLWSQYVSALERNAETDFVLTGSAGYSYRNSNSSLDLGSTFKWNSTGLGVTAGVSVPTNSFAPVVSLGVSFDPSKMKLAGIEAKQQELDIQQEDLALASAVISYETAVITQQSSLSDILWNMNTNTESYGLYDQMEGEYLAWYRQGIISENEYKSALLKKENYRIKCLVSRIELIIYNNETYLMFCRD